MPRISHILVAEDNEDDVFLLRQALKKVPKAAMLHVVNDGAQAVAWLQGTGKYGDRKQCPAPEVLLLDLNMPNLNGFEVLEWLRHDPKWSRLMVHVLTASSRESDVRKAYDLRANSYVVKPTRLDDLAGFMAALHTWQDFVSLPFGVPNDTATVAAEGNRRFASAASP